MARPLMTLLTDFGTADGYVGAVKGVIRSICPKADIVDLSHDVPAHDVVAASLALAASAPYFPPEALHVVIVDPTVGTDRKILVGRFGPHVYLFPDNGVISLIAESAEAASLNVVLAQPHAGAGPTSMTFHGRDIFAPVAARILMGQDIRRLGPQPASYTLLDIPEPQEQGEQLVGQVIHVDRFGNLITNIPAAEVMRKFESLDRLTARCGNRDAGRFQATYAFAGDQTPLVLFDSSGRVELAVNRGRACDVHEARVGTEVRLIAAP